MCTSCLQFLEAFLTTGLPDGVPLARLLRRRALHRVIPDLAPWFLSLHTKIPKQDFASAVETSSRIARRGRGALEYEILIKTSLCNLLKHQHPWIQKEMDTMNILFVEAGVFQDKEREDWKWLLTLAQGYLTYMLPGVYETLSDVHSSHTGGVGHETPVVAIRIPDDDEETLCDRDDYQREILMEVD